jgi:hypothetical protein
MTAWHGDPALRDAQIARMREHVAADRLIAGSYISTTDDGRGWIGCAHGCLTGEALVAERNLTSPARLRLDGSDWWAEGERLWGIPAPVGALIDRIFESLPADDRPLFVTGALEAMAAGADLSLVTDRVLLDLLADPEHGATRRTAEGGAQRAAMDRVAGLFVLRLAGDEPSHEVWVDARKAADAADAYAWDAAAAASYAASAAYAYAAYDAYDAADAASGHWPWVAARLLHHLSTAPVAVPA